MKLDAQVVEITPLAVSTAVVPRASMALLRWSAVVGSAVATVRRKAVALSFPGAGNIRSLPEMARYLEASAITPLEGEPEDATPSERRRVACLVAMNSDPNLYMRLNIRENTALFIQIAAAMPLVFTSVIGVAGMVALPIFAVASGATWAKLTAPESLSTLGICVTASVVSFLLMRFPMDWLLNKWRKPVEDVVISMRMGGWADTMPRLVDRFSVLTSDAPPALLSLRGVVLWHAAKAEASWNNPNNPNRSGLSMVMLRLLGTSDYIGMFRLHARLDACVNVGAIHGFRISGEESEMLERVNDRLRDRCPAATGA